jgi:hypothetical protein
MVKFELVNPIIGGEIKTKFDASNSDEAARSAWESISKPDIIMNNIPQFAFTLREGGGKLHHFLVKEEPNQKSAEYQIENITDSVNNGLSKERMSDFKNESERMKKQIDSGKLNGGRRRRYNKDDSSSSSSSSDSDDDLDLDDYFRYIRKNQYRTPLWWWWYTPTLYNVKSVFTPIFTPSVRPYVQLWIPSR